VVAFPAQKLDYAGNALLAYETVKVFFLFPSLAKRGQGRFDLLKNYYQISITYGLIKSPSIPLLQRGKLNS